MKRIVKNSLFTTILMVWGMMYSSCEGWTDPESINIHYPTFEEQNPQLYADYIRDLKRYKDGEHKLVFVSLTIRKLIQSIKPNVSPLYWTVWILSV